jgi:uncharacterized protein YdcH (DUF465 family)
MYLCVNIFGDAKKSGACAKRERGAGSLASTHNSLKVFSHLKGGISEMEMTTTDSLKEQLMATDPEFRELAREHGRYEARLTELSALAYPSDEEQLEEITLKKKKLAIKDQMHSIILQYQKDHSSTH